MQVDSSNGTADYLTGLLSRTPTSLHGHIESLQRCSERKLWHQLTNSLQAFLKAPESQSYQIELYDQFIKKFTPRLDQLRLVEMATTVAQQYDGASEQVGMEVNSSSLMNTAFFSCAMYRWECCPLVPKVAASSGRYAKY